eukprot:2004999-Rhodomonas_salina.1
MRRYSATGPSTKERYGGTRSSQSNSGTEERPDNLIHYPPIRSLDQIFAQAQVLLSCSAER